jgi:agmatinase
VQFGVRSICREEVEVVRSEPSRLRMWYVEEVHQNGWRRELCDRVRGRKVFLTIDVDGLDPAIIAATGTPEPDGLLWTQVLDIIRTVAQCGQIVGMDCVELAPSPGLHASEYAAAKLIYKAFTYALTHGQQAEEAARARSAQQEHGYGGLANEPELWPSKDEPTRT